MFYNTTLARPDTLRVMFLREYNYAFRLIKSSEEEEMLLSFADQFDVVCRPDGFNFNQAMEQLRYYTHMLVTRDSVKINIVPPAARAPFTEKKKQVVFNVQLQEHSELVGDYQTFIVPIKDGDTIDTYVSYLRHTGLINNSWVIIAEVNSDEIIDVGGVSHFTIMVRKVSNTENKSEPQFSIEAQAVMIQQINGKDFEKFTLRREKGLLIPWYQGLKDQTGLINNRLCKIIDVEVIAYTNNYTDIIITAEMQNSTESKVDSESQTEQVTDGSLRTVFFNAEFEGVDLNFKPTPIQVKGASDQIQYVSGQVRFSASFKINETTAIGKNVVINGINYVIIHAKEVDNLFGEYITYDVVVCQMPEGPFKVFPEDTKLSTNPKSSCHLGFYSKRELSKEINKDHTVVWKNAFYKVIVNRLNEINGEDILQNGSYANYIELASVVPSR